MRRKGTTAPREEVRVALLTGGGDRHYACGLATALASNGVRVDCVGGDEIDSPEMHDTAGLVFFNLKRDGRGRDGLLKKVTRTLSSYLRLVSYAATAKPKVFHILWNNRFEYFDRTLLTLYFRLLGKRIILTAHNVNAAARDGGDTALNRLTLKIQYQLASHIFVHTERMKRELVTGFHVNGDAVTVICYGINNAVPNTALTTGEARRRLGLTPDERAILFFGNIAPYKGVEYLVSAFERLASDAGANYRLIVAGRPKKGCEAYVEQITRAIQMGRGMAGSILRTELIPDEEVELYFKAADVLVLPYTHIFQSGVLFLGYSFGLPAIVTDVGSLEESVIAGKTGFVCKSRNAEDLETVIRRYFSSSLYSSLSRRRGEIRDYVAGRHSWSAVADTTYHVYAEELAKRREHLPSSFGMSDADTDGSRLVEPGRPGCSESGARYFGQEPGPGTTGARTSGDVMKVREL